MWVRASLSVVRAAEARPEVEISRVLGVLDLTPATFSPIVQSYPS